jgi:VCBS repeat-containing protein
LSDDADGRFEIDPDTGVITVAGGASFDHDTAAQHGIEVEVTDAGGLSTTRTFMIDVLAVNQAPIIAGLSASDLLEGAANGTVVGTVSASDLNPHDALTFALSDDADGRFTIDPETGVISVADGTLLDHESAAQHDIEVEATDTDGLSTTRAFTIAVADVNEAPSIVGLNSGEVAEDASEGAVVGTVGASDPDAGDALTFTLTDDADGRFVIDAHTGVIRLAEGAALDFENMMQHDIEVEVTDAGGLKATQSFTIALTNVNEQPVMQALSSNEVIEGAADGTVIGIASAFDPDGDDAFTFALTDDAGGRFAIDANTGVISVADGSLLDYDETDEHSIEVTVTDLGGLSHVATYVIELQKDNSGDDNLLGGAGADLLDGGPGDDSLNGGAGDDQLFGGAGDDQLEGGLGNDWLEGGDGDDSLFGNNNDDQLFGGDGNDQLLAGNGNDVVDGGADNDQLFGNSGDDRIDGGTGNDELFGSLGNDVLNGGDGSDGLFGGMGDDVLAGGAGDDRLAGDDSSDFGADRFVFASLDEVSTRSSTSVPAATSWRSAACWWALLRATRRPSSGLSTTAPTRRCR